MEDLCGLKSLDRKEDDQDDSENRDSFTGAEGLRAAGPCSPSTPNRLPLNSRDRELDVDGEGVTGGNSYGGKVCGRAGASAYTRRADVVELVECRKRGCGPSEERRHIVDFACALARQGPSAEDCGGDPASAEDAAPPTAIIARLDRVSRGEELSARRGRRSARPNRHANHSRGRILVIGRDTARRTRCIVVSHQAVHDVRDSRRSQRVVRLPHPQRLPAGAIERNCDGALYANPFRRPRWGPSREKGSR